MKTNIDSAPYESILSTGAVLSFLLKHYAFRKKSSPLSILLISLFLFVPSLAFSTTWDEPWKDEVIRKAGHFVLAKVLKADEEKGLEIEILKNPGGTELQGKISITDFYLLDLCSMSAGHGPEFPFEKDIVSYFFLSKNEKGEWCIATPTTGFDPVMDEKVQATYRHSYHQAMVPQEVYEYTMTAIFLHAHGKPYDQARIDSLVRSELSKKPAGFGDEEIDVFFLQHVALECIFHLQLKGYDALLLPFLRDYSNFHSQVSASRAAGFSSSPECLNALMEIVSKENADPFVRVIAIQALMLIKPTDKKNELLKIRKKAPEEGLNFGGNIMDPRVCTSLPSVKEALDKLIGML